jgi:uncharacterized protein YbbK (DUF523 family)
VDRILISACPTGDPVRFDGSHKRLVHALIDRWTAEGRLTPFCPECAGGLLTPRLALEIVGGDGEAIVARIQDVRVEDAPCQGVTAAFLAGAEAALTVAITARCRFALLVDGSPSCGFTFTFGGTFSGRRHTSAGVAAALLKNHGVQVSAPADIEALAAALQA